MATEHQTFLTLSNTLPIIMADSFTFKILKEKLQLKYTTLSGNAIQKRSSPREKTLFRQIRYYLDKYIF